MIGILIISENDVALEQVKSIDRLLGPQSALLALSLHSGLSFDEMNKKIEAALAQLNTKQVLIFNELWGSTQGRSCQCFLKKGSVESISGYNFPMLLKSFSLRQNGLSLEEMNKVLVKYGASHIWHVSDVTDKPC